MFGSMLKLLFSPSLPAHQNFRETACRCPHYEALLKPLKLSVVEVPSLEAAKEARVAIHHNDAPILVQRRPRTLIIWFPGIPSTFRLARCENLSIFRL